VCKYFPGISDFLLNKEALLRIYRKFWINNY